MNHNLLIVGEAGAMEEVLEAARTMAGQPFDRIDCVPLGRFMSRGSVGAAIVSVMAEMTIAIVQLIIVRNEIPRCA